MKPKLGLYKLKHIALFLPFWACLPSVGTAQVTEEQVLRFVERSLLTCNQFDQVQRTQSSFRVYERSVTRLYYEFDLKEMEVQGQVIADSLLLACTGMPCISSAAAIGGSWRTQQPQNRMLLKCPGSAERIAEAIKMLNQ